MSGLTWVEGDPPASDRRRGRPSGTPWMAELRARPGQWAELGRYKKESSPYSRGWQMAQRHPDLEYAVRHVGDEYVLFMRAVSS